MTRTCRTRALLTVLALAALLVVAACSSAVSGRGSVSSGSGSGAPSTHDFPASSAAPQTASGTASGGTTSARPSSSAATVSSADRELHLQAQTNGEPHVIVAVPGGYEAATFDQVGSIQFWHDPAATPVWQQVGQSSYPYAPQLGPPHATVLGALLARMTHATFIVHGVFTGDGSGTAVAFTTGANGWGAIKAEPNGNIGPSGRPVGTDRIGLSYEFGFVDGHLQTVDCPTNRPLSDCGQHPVRKLWTWTGRDFALA